MEIYSFHFKQFKLFSGPTMSSICYDLRFTDKLIEKKSFRLSLKVPVKKICSFSLKSHSSLFVTKIFINCISHRKTVQAFSENAQNLNSTAEHGTAVSSFMYTL